MLGQRTELVGTAALERFPVTLTWKSLRSWPGGALASMFVAFPFGKPVSTFPGNALMRLLHHVRCLQVPGAGRVAGILVAQRTFAGRDVIDRSPERKHDRLHAGISSVNMARAVATRTFGPTTTLPWPRISATGLSPSAAAKDWPSLPSRTSMLVVPPASRISQTGTPTCRKRGVVDHRPQRRRRDAERDHAH